MKSIDGFGGVKFETLDGAHVASFDYLHNRGAVSRVPVWWRKETVNRKVLKKLLGYQVKVRVYLQNLMSADEAAFAALATVMNTASAAQQPIYVSPRYDAASVYTVKLRCWLDSDIDFTDNSIFESGQKLELEFETETLLDSLQFIVNTYAPEVLLTESGVALLQENGHKLIIER